MNKVSKSMLGVIVLVCGLLATQAVAQSEPGGNADQGKSQGTVSSGTQQQPSSTDREVLSQGKKSDLDRISREVRHELLLLPYYNVFDNLAYEVRPDGTVMLTGQVVNATLKKDAEGRVRNVEGVEQVQNRIEVLPTSINDDRLRRQLYRAIYGHDALSKYAWGPVPSIHIIVKNGQVTLEGAVMNDMDKNLANIQANSVSGVFKVTNNLRVEKS
jgi:hyperosmotically inducible protein